MVANSHALTGKERTFKADEIIVSKTDTKGRLIYTNQTFLEVADYTEAEVIGQPHSMIRHPDMPRCVFKLLWDTISDGKELFAYVVNRTKYGDHYWVLAHVTPTFDEDGKTIKGYHSNRRVPSEEALEVIKPLYAELKAEEDRHANRKDGMNAAHQMLLDKLADAGMEYDEFILSL
ncbi:PAS domain-containing protein [Terasakiella sp. A23]|uniref:PAS domain-containing protein n=1 Tax=Terasakiella sp. FCG-A23 TaxID=3080561 RepID=UPI00295575EF|nr:PAS domain-containing protein [Terasakiella sp. A23]MDV7339244.1 PAS domain-containing protein [Terasakiella sp. A23]